MSKVRTEVPQWMLDAVNDADYQANFLKRARAGILGPLEKTLWERVYGKTPDEIHHHLHEDLTGKSTEELMSLLDDIKSELNQLDAQSIH